MVVRQRGGINLVELGLVCQAAKLVQVAHAAGAVQPGLGNLV